ncbi:MAG TPA: D-Ala-D-Ala carboxypeptidase family metallohydrolase [Vicinamibacterales bacterium]|nr:D-Ala-D-Ala carboxypeptidase family metallohydrolase [Vicinamibacterales bacterium]
MTGPSTHLTWRELGCKDGTAYPREFIDDGRAARLAAVFEAIRASCGHQPIAVLSAYRSPAHNRKVGGARNSQHVQGRALDLRPPKGWTVARFYERIRALAPALPDLKGIGRYATFVHIDVRPAPHLVVWNGGAAQKDAAA